MPKYTHDNIGEAIRTKFVTGVVATIDTANDMAAVDVSGHGYTPALPLFYHCDPDVALRNVGSLVGAAAAFSVGDQVVVMTKARGFGGYVPECVVGFADGNLRECAKNIIEEHVLLSDVMSASIGAAYLILTAIVPGAKYVTIWDIAGGEFVPKVKNKTLPCLYNDGGIVDRWIKSGENHSLRDAVQYVKPSTISDKRQMAGPAPGFFGDQYGLTNTRNNSENYDYDALLGDEYPFPPPLYSMGLKRFGQGFATDYPCIRTRVVSFDDSYYNDQCNSGSTRWFTFYCYTPIGDFSPIALKISNQWKTGTKTPFFPVSNGLQHGYICINRDADRTKWEPFGILVPRWGSMIHWCDIALFHIYYVAPNVKKTEHSGWSVGQVITWEREPSQVVAGISYFPDGDAKEDEDGNAKDPFDVVRSSDFEVAIKDLIDMALGALGDDENIYWITTKVIEAEDPLSFEK